MIQKNKFISSASESDVSLEKIKAPEGVDLHAFKTLVNKYGLNPEDNSEILKGRLKKKNRYGMKQERIFKLYMNGQLKYYADCKLKGIIELTKSSKAKKVSNQEIILKVPENHKQTYALFG